MYVDTLFALVGGTMLVLYPVVNLWDTENVSHYQDNIMSTEEASYLITTTRLGFCRGQDSKID